MTSKRKILLSKIVDIGIVLLGISYFITGVCLFAGKNIYLPLAGLMSGFSLIYLKNFMPAFSKVFILGTLIFLPFILVIIGNSIGGARYENPLEAVRLAIIVYSFLPSIVFFISGNAVAKFPNLFWIYKIALCVVFYASAIAVVYGFCRGNQNTILYSTAVSLIPAYILASLAYLKFGREKVFQ